MAEILKKFEFRKAGRPAAKYPWDNWEDGRIWKVARGEDFDCKLVSFRNLLHIRAGLMGGKVRTNIDGDSVIFQFFEASTGQAKQ